MRLFCGLMLVAAGAAAQPPRPALVRAQTLLAEGDWQRAATELEAEYTASKDAQLLDDVGRAYENAAEYKKAVQYYTKYLEAFPAASNYDEVNKAVLELTPMTFKGAGPPKSDRFPPHIRHEVKKAWPAGEAIVIEALIEDHTGVYEPTVYYRRGTGAFVAAPMSVSGENKYVGLIAPMMEVGELQYFVEAFDSKGNGPSRSGTPSFPYMLRIVLPSQVPLAEGEAPPVQLPPLVQAPELGTESATGEPVSMGPAARRGPWAYVTMGAGVVAAGLGTYFGMRAVSSSGEWRSALEEGSRVDAMGKTQSSATAATVCWTAAGLLTAGGGALFFLTSF